MVGLLAISIVLGIAIMLLYVSGAFKSPYFGFSSILLVRWVFYLLLVRLALWYGGKHGFPDAYDSTVIMR